MDGRFQVYQPSENVVTALVEESAQADRAIEVLLKQGFMREQIQTRTQDRLPIKERGEHSSTASLNEALREGGNKAKVGALVGLIFGGTLCAFLAAANAVELIGIPGMSGYGREDPIVATTVGTLLGYAVGGGIGWAFGARVRKSTSTAHRARPFSVEPERTDILIQVEPRSYAQVVYLRNRWAKDVEEGGMPSVQRTG